MNQAICLLAYLLITSSCSHNDSMQKTEENEQVKSLAIRVKNMMVKVEGGTFTMGQTTAGIEPSDRNLSRAESDASDNNDPRPDELPLHQVTVSDFEISKYEVTQGLWKEVMGELSPCYSSNTYGEDAERAMDGVSWEDAMNFIAKLNELTQDAYRLPTEAEWEYAARGGKNSLDYRYSGSNLYNEVAWSKENNVSCVQKVAQKKPNELGLYDMSGNAFEWCYDWYGAYSVTAQTNPKGPSDNDKTYDYAGKKVYTHVLRGGHWQSSSFGLRVSFRTKIPTTNYRPKTGFRIAKGIYYDEMKYYAPNQK